MKTIREEYKEMKRELKAWNDKSNWDNTKYAYPIEHYTNKAKAEFTKLLNKDFEEMNLDFELGVISVEKYNKLWKVWNDCSNSVSNMNIIK